MNIIKKLVLIVFLVIPTSIRGQATESNLVDTSKPSICISYVRKGKIDPLFEGDGNARVWLRLHNNTRIPIFLCHIKYLRLMGMQVLAAPFTRVCQWERNVWNRMATLGPMCVKSLKYGQANRVFLVCCPRN